VSDRAIQVLLIEDSHADARLIQEELAEAGVNAFELERAETLAAGVGRLLEGGIDVALVDLSLPDSYGLDTFLSVWRESPAVPIVVLTGLDDEDVAIQAVQAGAQDYLVKGQADANLLTRAIRYAIERHRLLAQLQQRTLELQSSREGLRKVVEKSANGIVIVGKDGTVRSANLAAGTLLGRPCPGLVGQRFEFATVVGATKEIDIGESEAGPRAAEMSVEEIEWDGERAHLVSLRDITDRRQVEEALGESEEEYRSLVENVNVGVYRSSGGPDGRFLKANPAIVKMFGYDSVEDLMGVAVSDLYQEPGDRQQFIAKIGRDEAVKEMELRLRKKDGTPIWASCTARARLGDEGAIKWIDGVVEDISERKNAEALSKAFASLGEKLSSARATKEAARIIVQTADELLGWDACFVMLCSQDAQALQPILFMDHVGGRRVELPLPPGGSEVYPLAQLTSKEGAQLIVREGPREGPALARFGDVDRPSASLMSVAIRHSNTTLGVLSIQSYLPRAYGEQDLSTLQALADHCGGALERIWAEDALRASEALSRTTVGAIDEGIHVVGPDLRIVLFNDTFRRWCKELGLESDAVGRTVFEAFPFLSETVRDDYRQVIETGTPLVTEETHVIAGRQIVTETRKIPVVHDGEVAQVVTAVHDITERRRMEREILEISGREQQRFGQDLHDGLCQHLTGIAFMAQTLAGRLEAKGTPEAKDVAKINALINDAIAQARGLVKGLSPIDLGAGGLSPALEQIAASMGDLFGRPCTFAGDASVVIDDSTTATHIYRIAQEAVNNAARHSQANHVRIGLKSAREHVELTVRDDGVGIPNDLGQCSGMGIRIMNYRASMIGASLRIEEAVGGGTVVTCLLQYPQDRSGGS